MLAGAVGREVAQRLGAVLAPTLWVGCAEQHDLLSGTLSLRSATLTAVAVEQALSLARQGFTLVALLSTHGGNLPALDAALAQLENLLEGAVACAPRGDVGPDPGTHSGAWLTSVMLALRPDLVNLGRAAPDLCSELRWASPRRGHAAFERFVDSIATRIRTAHPS